jgi:hypothetical protein
MNPTSFSLFHDHLFNISFARVAELVDAADSKSAVRKDVLVRFQSRAHNWINGNRFYGCHFYFPLALSVLLQSMHEQFAP